MFKRILLFVFLFLIAGASRTWAQTAALQGHSFLGGTQAATSGLNSTNYLDGIIPSATITVYLTGTQTLATLYANSSGTPLSNPFTSNTVNSVNPGGWIFFAAVNQGYDIVMSGGIQPNTYPQPVTLVDQFPGFEFTYVNAGCVGPLPTDATSTNCGNGNLVGNTATRVQTFGYTNADSIANASAKAFFGAGNLTANGLGVTDPIVGAGYDNFLIGTIPAADVTLQDAYAFGNENVNLSGTSTHFSADVLLAEGFDNICSSNPGNATFNDDYFFGESVFCYTANGGTVNVSNVLAAGDTVGNMTIGTGTLTLSEMVALGDQTGEFGLTNGTDTTHDVVAIGNVTGIGDNDSYLNAIGSSTLGFVENSNNINGIGFQVGGGLTNSHDLFLYGDTILNGATHNALVNGIAIGYDVLPQTAVASLTDFICQGDNSCASVTGGSDFVAIGKTAGGSDATGSNWVSVGDGSGATGAAFSNWAAIGPNAHVTASNQMTLGNSSMTSLNLYGTGSGNGFLYSSGNAVSLQAGQIAPVNQVYYYCQATGMHCDARGSLITTGMALDGVTNSTTTFTSATANFTSADVGKVIILAQGSTATTVPSGTTISSVTNSTTVVMSNAASATATGVQWTVGTDDTTPFQNLLNSLVNIGARIVGTPGKVSLVNGAIAIPNTGVALDSGIYGQSALTIDGQCNSVDPALHNLPAPGCFTLDMTANVSPKVTTYGAGILTLRNLVAMDTGSDCSNYWFYTTNTRLDVLRDTFVGPGAGQTSSCSRLFELGGTTTTIGNAPNDAFQGFGTKFVGNTFHRFAHTIDAFTYANKVSVENNVWANDNGSSTANDAYNNVTGFGTGANDDSGWTIDNNLVEMTYIPYFFSGTNWEGTSAKGNVYYDQGASSKALFHFGTGSDTEYIECEGTSGSVGDQCTDTHAEWVIDMTPGFTQIGGSPSFSFGFTVPDEQCVYNTGGICVFTNNSRFQIRINNVFQDLWGSLTATVSGCSAGAVTGNSRNGKVTLGANTCSLTITPNGSNNLTATHGWTCWANDETTAAMIRETASTTTTATLSVPATAGITDTIDFGCSPF